MTEQKLYTHTHYIWHRLLLRLVILAPIRITEFVALCISGACDGLYQVFDKMLPVHYRQTQVEFDQLSKGEQEAIERVAKARGVILSQVQCTGDNP
jgi:hypothetical protein